MPSCAIGRGSCVDGFQGNGSRDLLIGSGAERFDDLRISQLRDNVMICFANFRIRVEDHDVSAIDTTDFIF